MVALGRGASPVDAVPLAGTPRAVAVLPESLVALGDLPGARYVLVVDASGERVRGEIGGPPGSDLAVLTWARRLADVSRERGRALEDVVLTTESDLHLVRSVPASAAGEDVWVVLRLDRERGNLALARRALAALGAGRSGRSRALPSSSTPEPRIPSPAAPVSGSFPAVPGSPVTAVSGSPSRVTPVSGSAAPFGGSACPDRSRPERGPVRPDAGPVTGSLPAAMPSAGTPIPLPPAPRRDRELPRPTAGAGADVPALAFLPPTRATARPALAAPEEVPPPPAAPTDPVLPRRRPAPRAGGPVDASGDTDGPSPSAGSVAAPSAGGPVDASGDTDGPSLSAGAAAAPSTDGPVDASGDTDGPFLPAEDDPTTPGLWDPRRRPLTVRQARTWRTEPEVPAAREPAEPTASAPTPVVPAPRTASLFAPVVVVPPPPSPVDDDTTEVPAPVPYPIITAPPLEPAPEPTSTAPEPAPEEEPAVTDVGLPRRVPGAQLRSPTPAPDPAPAAALSAAGIPGWSTEQSVLRRLLLGLRRLT